MQADVVHKGLAMKIAVYGLGYVGAVTVACLAELGHEVVGVDRVDAKADALMAGTAPVVEPGLDAMLSRNVEAGRITATTDGVAAAVTADLVILAVGTPSTPSGGVDSAALLHVAANVGAGLQQNTNAFVPVLVRSTSLPEVHGLVAAALVEASERELGTSLGYACHPEFLRETTAIADFFEPPVIVFGADEARTFEVCRDLYPGIEAEVVEVGVGEASLVKYAANCFHAAKVTFANEIGELARAVGVDARQVMDIFCLDDKLNISTKYLRPGNPFGGSCLPKDLRAVLDLGRREALTLPFLNGAIASNRAQIDSLTQRVLAEGPAKVAIVGLSFKEGTDDLREAPMVALVERLIGKGVEVAIYDAELAVDQLVGANARFALDALPHLANLVGSDLPAIVQGSDVTVINHRNAATDWSFAFESPATTIIDLCSVDELAEHPGYRGLYWAHG